MAQNSEWGPPLWNILHICAEKSGKQFTHILHTDEIRAWIQLLKLLEGILPCPLCQKHYKTWITQHSVYSFLDIRAPQAFYEKIRRWLWELHDTIHRQRGIQGPTYEDAMALYTNRGTRELQQSLEKLMEVLDRAILLRLIRGEFVREWKGRLGFLRKLLHV
ncbi:hypothetical protein EBR66_06805 [bacterium]|nr:hypothetical protein [bacterium]